MYILKFVYSKSNAFCVCMICHASLQSLISVWGSHSEADFSTFNFGGGICLGEVSLDFHQIMAHAGMEPLKVVLSLGISVKYVLCADEGSDIGTTNRAFAKFWHVLQVEAVKMAQVVNPSCTSKNAAWLSYKFF